MVQVSKLLIPTFLSLTITAASVIPKEDTICSPEDPKDCYPLQLVPTTEWQRIKEGQYIPQGLDIRVDWQTGEKFAKLTDSSEHDLTKEVVVKDIIESDSNKVVSYSSEEDPEGYIQKLKMVAAASNAPLDLENALAVVREHTSNKKPDDLKLTSALDSLSEHSHNLKDGIIITESESFSKLLELATSQKFSAEIRELSLRVIAQSLRHNSEALSNIDVKPVLSKLLADLKVETNSVIQKRLLGVISSLVQTSENSKIFNTLDGETKLIDSFEKLKQDSRVRVLEILEDLKSASLLKRSHEEQTEIDEELFRVIQKSLANGSVDDEHSLEILFDKLVSLKTVNKSFKVKSDFLEWLTDYIHNRRVNKRDNQDDELHKKLLEARHLVFGNPNALRKATADEL